MKCKYCGIDFVGAIKDICSKECAQLYFDERRHDVITNDDSIQKI